MPHSIRSPAKEVFLKNIYTSPVGFKKKKKCRINFFCLTDDGYDKCKYTLHGSIVYQYVMPASQLFLILSSFCF